MSFEERIFLNIWYHQRNYINGIAWATDKDKSLINISNNSVPSMLP